MKFSALAIALFAQAAFAAPLTRRADPIPTAEEIARLAPDLGALPNTNPNSGGDCDGPRQLDGKIPRVPCACPPLHDAYIQALTTNVLAGRAVNNTVVNVGFPVGDSLNDKHGRITAAIITLQNLNGPGKGCPGVSTTLGIQSKNLDTCGDFFCNGEQPSENTGAVPATESSGETATASAADPSPSATSSESPAPTDAPAQNNGNGNDNAGAGSTVTVTSITVVTSTETVTRGQETATASAGGNDNGNAADNNGDNGGSNNNNDNNNGGNNNDNNNNNNSGVITRELVDQLAPQLGSEPNNNPNQFGDCDGPQQPDGKIPRVPCQCPPTRDVFIDQLLANIQAGHALKNPTVGVNFPTGNSKADQRARITAGTVTLQNLDGPGKGCPNVSTTFAAQSNAIDAA